MSGNAGFKDVRFSKSGTGKKNNGKKKQVGYDLC